METISKSIVIYSIGHSNHPFEKFLQLLKQHEIEAIVDVRSLPFSRHNPQYSMHVLEDSLKRNNIAYLFLGDELGARRHEAECYYEGKVNYDQIPKMQSFQHGIIKLIDRASSMRVAMLCAEKDPLRCHRTILIGRYIKNIVKNVLHILPDGGIETQAQAEQRLLTESNLHENDLFLPREQRIVEAYQRRATNIAYQESGRHA